MDQQERTDMELRLWAEAQRITEWDSDCFLVERPLVWSRKLSDEEHQIVTEYFSKKYGLEL